MSDIYYKDDTDSTDSTDNKDTKDTIKESVKDDTIEEICSSVENYNQINNISIDLKDVKYVFAEDFETFMDLIYNINKNRNTKDIYNTFTQNIKEYKNFQKHDVLSIGFCFKGFKTNSSFWKIIEVIKFHKPKVVLFENVENLKEQIKDLDVDCLLKMRYFMSKLGYYVNVYNLSVNYNKDDKDDNEQKEEKNETVKDHKVYVICFDSKDLAEDFEKKFNKFGGYYIEYNKNFSLHNLNNVVDVMDKEEEKKENKEDKKDKKDRKDIIIKQRYKEFVKDSLIPMKTPFIYIKDKDNGVLFDEENVRIKINQNVIVFSDDDIQYQYNVYKKDKQDEEDEEDFKKFMKYYKEGKIVSNNDEIKKIPYMSYIPGLNMFVKQLKILNKEIEIN